MIDTPRTLRPHTVQSNLKLLSPGSDSGLKVTENHPATSVMTDLSVTPPFQIDSKANLQQANDKMIASGVRMLFVNNSQGELTGLITSTDILGEKPLLFMNQNGGSRQDITAGDIMTPLSQLDALPIKQVAQAKVGDVVSALKECRRHHMLVTEQREDGEYIRGIFSVTQVGRQLGIEINPNQRAESFAQIREALA